MSQYQSSRTTPATITSTSQREITTHHNILNTTRNMKQYVLKQETLLRTKDLKTRRLRRAADGRNSAHENRD